ncbi:MAG: carboxypeptidase regulatory-like domain-containing protein [Richelia sp. RM2_1_2]|nr:carboxypeptidase regulatory-like domain-containing protein [Richelia sp. SM1_7_0]NJN10567.1 carboxypeptidase regulatory-like domain-containing protein [Richelia sp. RM1_1_1]NJO64759.1 carboxypeptidase regulatory-like domain-containing protein [Richelia sp. RM2_1_2]
MNYPDIPIQPTVEIIKIQPYKDYKSSAKEKSTPISKTSYSFTLAQDDNRKEISNIESSLTQPEFSKNINDKLKESKDAFIILPVGINLGNRNASESTLIRGFEDGRQAVNFDNWLLAFDDVISALNITVNTLDDGQLELRSPGLVTRINPKDLKTDSELGLVISVADIKNILGVPTEFDIVKYAVVFNPPWLGLRKKGTRQTELPVILDGLPQVNSPAFSFSTIRQSINISGTDDNTNTQGNLTTIGTILGGSWYIRTNQPTLTDRKTWNINEAQYLRQTPTSDYVVGSQPTFWQTQETGQFWGVTTVQRFGYTPPLTDGGGFSPSRRMQSNQIGRTISGEAAPGTLVQLTQGFGDDVIAEVLVDSSGVYRFENIPTAASGFNNFNNDNYRVRLYPNGQLTATPEIRQANFTSLPGQLTKGTSAIIVSSGLSRENTQNSLLGNFSNLRGGVAYRLGVSEDLTLGTGVIYDKSMLGLGELFYQPAGFPLEVAFSGLLGTDEGLEYNADIRFRPSNDFDLNLNSDKFSQRFWANWRALKGISFRASGNTREKALAAGMSFSRSSKGFYTFASADIDTNNNFRWSLNSRLGKIQLRNFGNEIATNSQLSYNFSKSSSIGNSLNLNYETSNDNDLASFNWSYRSKSRDRYGGSLFDFDLGYGIGSQGSGIIASASTAAILGMNLRLRYQGISTTSASDSFRIELSPSFYIQPKLAFGDSRYDRLRGEGGLLIQPFLDKNGNGKLDRNEKIYTEDADLLFSLNNKSIRNLRPDFSNNGVLLQMAPNNYRLDLDPAGYPIDWKPTQTAYAVEVAAGGFTQILVPFTPSYTVAGTVTDAEGKPIGGARVEAVVTDKDKNKKIISVTNGAGIFFLENLQQGNYKLLVNDQSANPGEINIDGNSETMHEVKLKI